MRLGSYTFEDPLLLAPMAAVSELPFRRIVLEMGASLAPTELISAEGLVRGHERTMRYLRHDPQHERPFYVQLFGGDPQRMAAAARVAAEHGAELLDVNMGCPVPKVTRNGAGSALMAEPDRAARIIEAVRVATGLPVTAKIRSGWDSSSINAVEVARALEAAGASAIAIHARTRAQGYSGRADWSVIAAVKRAVGIPVIGNGDVATRADAERMREQTGCDAVMVGRAALGNPWVFRELRGGPGATAAERLSMVLRHLDEHLSAFEDPVAGVRAFRKMLLWYARGLRGASGFRVRATALERAEELRAEIERFFGEAERDPGATAEPVEVGPG
jgi:nifR3 family TIM-barrel protein